MAEKLHNTESEFESAISSDEFLSNINAEHPELLLRVPDIAPKGDHHDIPIVENNEPLVKIGETDRIFSENYYHEHGYPKYEDDNPLEPAEHIALPDTLADNYLRESVVGKLKQMLEYLPEDTSLLVLDGYRPLSTQSALFNTQYDVEVGRHPEIFTEQESGDAEMTTMDTARQFYSIPSRDSKRPATHNTGGAVDVTLADKEGKPLDLGVGFDFMGDQTENQYYEKQLDNGVDLSEDELKRLFRRRVLNNIALKVGFKLYDGEPWHFDYGNQWGTDLNSEAVYGPIELGGISVPEEPALAA